MIVLETKKGVLNTGKQELVIEEINLSKRLSCSHLFLALTADWGYTKMEVLRTFLCETCELCTGLPGYMVLSDGHR